jgi:hypothetical protein
MQARLRLVRFAIASIVLALAAGAPSRAQDCGFVPTGASWSNVRYGGDVRSSGDVFGRPAVSSQSFTFISEGKYNFGTEAALAVDADAFDASASVGGSVTIDPIYAGGGGGTASGVWRDCVTISGHAGAGQLRIPIDLDGARTISWSIGGAYQVPGGSLPIGVARGYVSCTAFTVGAVVPDTCPDFAFEWTDSAAIDETVTLIAPFTFGAPFDFRIEPTVSVGLGYSTPTGQTGVLAGNVGIDLTGTLLAATVTDTLGTPLAGVTIDAESGFDYLTAPEPGATLAALLALASLAAVRASR